MDEEEIITNNDPTTTEPDPDPSEQDTPTPEEPVTPSNTQGASTATWSDFSTGPVEGMVAGFPVTGNNLDLSMAAPLERYALKDFSEWRLLIDGITLLVDGNGTVVQVTPASEKFSVGSTVKLYQASIAATKDSSYETRDGSTVDLSSLSPRDYFAMEVLQALVRFQPNPDAIDDARILYLARAAYRYAQGMIMAASETRTGSQETVPPVTPTTTSEKILQGINTSINGLATQLQTSLAATLKVDNPTGEKFDIEGGGGGGTPAGSTNLSGLSDVALSSPANGQVLKFNGTKWVNGTDEQGSGGGGSGFDPTQPVSFENIVDFSQSETPEGGTPQTLYSIKVDGDNKGGFISFDEDSLIGYKDEGTTVEDVYHPDWKFLVSAFDKLTLRAGGYDALIANANGIDRIRVDEETKDFQEMTITYKSMRALLDRLEVFIDTPISARYNATAKEWDYSIPTPYANQVEGFFYLYGTIPLQGSIQDGEQHQSTNITAPVVKLELFAGIPRLSAVSCNDHFVTYDIKTGVAVSIVSSTVNSYIESLVDAGAGETFGKTYVPSVHTLDEITPILAVITPSLS